MEFRLKNKIIPLLILCILLTGVVLPASALAAGNNRPYDIFEKLTIKMPGEQEYVPGEILVKFKPGVSEEKIARINAGHGTQAVYASPYAGFKKLKIPKTKNVEEMVETYSRNPNVEYAVPNAIAHAAGAPDDPYYYLQWNFKDGIGGINVEPAWEISTGEGVTVAVLDSGVAYENYGPYSIAPDLAGTSFTPGYDFINNDAHPNDDNQHGTHVAGTIAQSTNNGYGVAGVAYDCTIMPVKVLDAEGSGTLQQLIDGIYFAADNGAQVISMSLGFSPGYYPGPALDNALEYAYDNGITIVAAAGNDGTGTVGYPAAYDKCIAVGATKYDGTLAYYSNYGSALDVTAPGGDSTVDQNGDGYGDGILQNTFDGDPTKFNFWFFQGTSMATPHVSGVAALLIANGSSTPEEVRTAIEQSAKDKGEPGWDQYYGYGIVDAKAALDYMGKAQQPPAPNTPPVANAGGPYSAEEGQTVTFNGSNSYDPDQDGSIVSYEWDFGDGSTGSGETATHNYNEAGVYIVSLTVRDNENAASTGSTTVEISEVPTTKPVNNPPVADTGGPYSAEEGQPVAFDGSNSSDPDPDGGIASYEWDFGDGSSGTGVAPKHSYTGAGTYNVILTVTDNKGATDTDTTTTEVAAANSGASLYIDSVEVTPNLRNAGRNTFVSGKAVVTVRDSNGNPVEDAKVSGDWSGSVSEPNSAVTNANGAVTVYSDEVKYKKGTLTFTFTVNSVSHTIPWNGDVKSGTTSYTES
ncbi:S8 family serine peptidase [Methanosarcina sp. Mfa9]|uniref:S8 family serine peptidase n=1 Tax=Methanosarcina sp. Mfa9 TaxID=3439063 RepID=UPI003F86BBBC